MGYDERWWLGGWTPGGAGRCREDGTTGSQIKGPHESVALIPPRMNRGELYRRGMPEDLRQAPDNG